VVTVVRNAEMLRATRAPTVSPTDSSSKPLSD
jgi:hypothetical protein